MQGLYIIILEEKRFEQYKTITCRSKEPRENTAD